MIVAGLFFALRDCPGRYTRRRECRKKQLHMTGEPFREVPPVVLYPGQQTIPETQKVIEGDMKRRMFNIKTMALGAMFVAVGVLLTFIKIPLSAVTEITLTGLPMAAGGYMLGPGMGFVIGALIDFIGFLAAPKGAYFPGFTLSSGLAGAIYGLLLNHNCWEKRVKENPVLAGGNKGLILRIIIAHLIKTITISLCLNCTWLSVFYGMPFMAVFTASLPKELINFPVEVFLIYSLIAVLKRIRSVDGEMIQH